MPSPAPEAVRTEALALRRIGWTCAHVAVALGVSPQAVGRWSKDVQVVKARKAKQSKNLDASHPDYGPECPECGKHKSLSAFMCAECRARARVGQAPRQRQYNAAELARVWPMPVAFPPIVARAPSAHRSIVWEGDDD